MMGDRTMAAADWETNGRRSVKEIIQSIAGDIQDIIRSEMRLAKEEVTEEARKAAKAGGLFAGAGILGLFAGMSLVASVIAALSLVMPVWLAALATTVLLAAAGYILFAAAKDRMRQVHPVPPKTVESIKEDARWVKMRKS